ncbi:permease for cytosine/purines, uracil, thiamine, allantoin-domain-containing protein [Suillus discolor]|uniref:Permease for cytosine/purines, uracil, thiamine, allantoin-domain-containing protein n=1 Tax=Suillus discolor TaxID=1912936 RepID=A0A9P7EUP6_9AGAM|nr:permease for cytosine/purines, uracil, thiamine, allantoin-domain-containing protein [Suillus discolor]KAG2089315.1 permease for cytosine/purines, uracil, thiamine, allantoin-domain-containing protein [Suillus discolor]
MSNNHLQEKNSTTDPEKDSAYRDGLSAIIPGDKHGWLSHPLAKSLLSWGVEERGTIPVPEEERMDTQYYKIFFLWFSMNFNILSFSAGTIGPIAFGLGLRDSCLVILFFNILACALPAYLNTWGPRIGMRQMIQSRYSFGYFGVIIPAILNLIGMCGFNILNGILGGQALASVSGNMSWDVGIVIIFVIALLVRPLTSPSWATEYLTGTNVFHGSQVLIAFLVVLGVGGKNLYNAQPAEPASAATILNFGSVIAGFVITYSPLASDFTMYYSPTVPRSRIFWYAYAGYIVPIVLLQCLGAAAVLAAPNVPSWNEGYGTEGNVGGLLEAMLSPVGNFGKFLTVLLSLSVTSNIAGTLYSICFNFQVMIPAMSRVPRYVFSIVGTVIALPLSIVGAHRFYAALTDFLSLIGYWASAYGAILLVEHHYFRKGDFSTYNHAIWNIPGHLPWGAAALTAGILSFALIIPCMNQVWYQGPIGITSGDIGFEIAFPLAALLYIPLRKLELKYQNTK